MTLLLWVLLGIAAGWISSIILRTHATQGLVTDIILGIVGAMAGGLLLNVLGRSIIGGFDMYSIAIVTLTAIILIWFGRMINAPAR
jgi:uncharacterized membrane protein YeaQ/YmgE (transglycosylase-associated protein family)